LYASFGLFWSLLHASFGLYKSLLCASLDLYRSPVTFLWCLRVFISETEEKLGTKADAKALLQKAGWTEVRELMGEIYFFVVCVWVNVCV